jgi:hypothetical protein
MSLASLNIDLEVISSSYSLMIDSNQTDDLQPSIEYLEYNI